MDILSNPLLRADSYKLSHFMQYPKHTSDIMSYVTARGTTIEGVTEVVFNGLQPWIIQTLLTPITKAQVIEAAEFAAIHGTPFNTDGFMHIVDKYDGFFPVEIKAVPEGTPVPLQGLMVSIHNLGDDQTAFLPSFLETGIMSASWYGSTVATISRECKRIIKRYLDETSDNAEAEIAFKLHDFGFRGVSSFESAAIGGAAHLINFMGTDTIAGIGHAMKYYNADVCGFSISASEHSTMTIRGRDHELESYQAMIDAYAKPGSLFAIVSDSYDIYNAVENIYVGQGLLKQVRDIGATMVIRPDSGNPLEVPIDIIKLLWDLLPEKLVNTKGYKLLPPYVRVIQGDGINITSLGQICENLKAAGFSASNLGFGMGGGLLQHCNRDTFKFAMKASAAQISGKWVDVYKDPITDSGKRSRRGQLDLFRDKVTGELLTLRTDGGDPLEFNGMRYYYNGHEVVPATRTVYRYDAVRGMKTQFINFNDVRKNAELK